MTNQRIIGQPFIQPGVQPQNVLSVVPQMQTSALANALSGTGVPTVITDPIQLSTKKEGITVAKKTKVGTAKKSFKYYLADKKGNVYQVDKSAYNAARVNGNIKLAGASATPVDPKKLPAKVQNQVKGLLPKPSEAAAVKNPNPSHPSNATLGKTNADPRRWYERPAVNYTKPEVSGVVEADRRAEEIIRRRAQGGIDQPVVPTPPAPPTPPVKPPVNPTPNNVGGSSNIFPTADGREYGRMLGEDFPISITPLAPSVPPVNPPTPPVNPPAPQVIDNIVDNGKLDKFGNKINEFGERFDKYGNKLDEFGNKFDDFGNRFNNIDDHLGNLDGKVDDLCQNIDKFKRGVGEANGKIIGKIDGLTETVTGLNGKIDDVTQNVDKLKRGLGEVSGKIIGKIDEQGKVINELANKTDDIAQNVDKLKRGLGEVSGKIIAKVDDNSKAIGELGSKVDDIAKQMSKQNTKMALIGGAIALAGIAAAGIAGYLLGKNNDKDDKVQAEDTTPVVKPEKEEKPEETTPVAPVVPVDPTDPTEPTEPTTPVTPVDPVDPNSPIDADGNATVKKGDGLWHIAERYLEYKFKNEPDKFKNLTETEKNQMIWKEVHRIADLNGFKLVSSIIKGKKLLVTDPMLHTGDKVQVVKKVDIAA